LARTYQLRQPQTQASRTIDWQGGLHDEQRSVVQAPTDIMLVLAGAGSGKTRTLTWRVAWLMDQGADPLRMLLLTFTNRAAREMTDRVGELLQRDTRTMFAGTFHSIGRRILRDHATLLGWPAEFSILDGEDAETLMKAVLADLPAAEAQRTRFPKPRLVLTILSDALNTGQTTDAVLLQKHPHFLEHRDRIELALRGYVARKREYGLMDFDDLLHQWLQLLEHHPDVLAHWQQHFQHVLVDEYQDTNHVQSRIVELLAQGHRSLMVVGDDAQSIYAFRGANDRNILEFPDRHPGCRVFQLRHNWRSSPQIIALANASIAFNRRQFPKALLAEQPAGPLPALLRPRDDRQQAAFVADRMLDLRDEGVPLENIAVLYRTHAQSVEIQVELDRRGIPYVVRSGARFFEQKHIKDILAFLRFLENPRDELSLLRFLQLGEGIGMATAGRLSLWLQQAPSLDTALDDPPALRVVGRRGEAGWQTLRAVLTPMLDPARRQNAGWAVDHIRQTFYDDYARRLFDNAPQRLREIETLASFAAQRGSVRQMLDELSLTTAASGVDVQGGPQDERVVLSTIHQAKGLEFDAVFVPWLCDDHFPSSRARHSEQELEEERRLFYVAVTRARRELYLLSPMLSFDRLEGTILCRLSPFLEELRRPGEDALWEEWALA
jgi:DNA helicase-2/ATP-dependent DNA helicase PcrA